MGRAGRGLSIVVAACLLGCATPPRDVPRFSKNLLTPAQLTAAQQFSIGELGARSAASREVWGLLPTEGLRRADWSVQLDALPYRMKLAQLIRLLGRPDKYERFRDAPYVESMYRLTNRDPASRHFDGFAVAKYLLVCPPGQRGAKQCLYLNVTLWRDTVIEALLMQGDF